MVTLSPGDIDVGIQSLLVQIYRILLSTLLSIDRQRLSLFDANFVLALSSSPLTVYLVVASICDLCGIRTGLYKRIKSYRLITRILGAVVLPLWIGLSMFTIMSTKAFKDSLCDPGTFKDWLQHIAVLFLLNFTNPGRIMFWLGLLMSFTSLSMLRLRQIKADVKLCSEGVSRLRVLWIWMKCTWCVPVDIGPRLVKFNAIKVHD